MNSDSNNLHVFAGKEAYRHIKHNGLKPDDIGMLLGASSGPKWLTLQAIDEYLLNEFFVGRTKELHLMGTSAGAWRMASFAVDMSAPTGKESAHKRFTELYIEQRYSEKPSGKEILDTCRGIVKGLLKDGGAERILNHPYVRMNLITTQCHGLTSSNNKYLKMLGFGSASVLNAVSRKSLGSRFTRVVMHYPQDPSPSYKLDEIPTRYSALTRDNLEDAILSTGSIPVLIDGVKDVAGKGVYQDGGITDYGFDLPLLPKNGFVLYPPFSKFPAPGWFDKSWFFKNSKSKRCVKRTPSQENYSKTIMLVPSDSFIAGLPGGKIPDRHDFLNFDDAARIKNWRDVVSQTGRLAEELRTMNWSDRVQPLPW